MLAILVYFVAIFILTMATYYETDMQYLQRFGYLPRQSSMSRLSEEAVSDAISELQRVAGIPITGKMDSETRRVLSLKRCGLSDEELVKHQRDWHIRRKKKRYLLNREKWQKHEIRYRITNVPRSMPSEGDVRLEVHYAFDAWNRVSKIRLTESSDPNADILVSFHRLNHGDPYPFDSKGAVLAHAFSPGELDISGDIHFDDDEHWTHEIGDQNHQKVNLKAVTMHEIGHSLGLGHSEVKESIMYPYHQAGVTKLHKDDVDAIQKLYGNNGYVHPTDPPTTQTTSSSSTTTTTREPMYNPLPHEDDLPLDSCHSSIDAIISVGPEIFIFHGKWYWRVWQDGSLHESPREVKTFWPELPTPIDGAFELKNRIFFFHERKIFEYQGTRLISVRTLSDIGIPAEVKQIRLAYTWYYWHDDPKYYIWTEEDYWKLDTNSMKVEVDYPRKIDDNWRRVPKNASAAFSWHGELFFFAGYDVLKFGTLKMSILPDYPKPFAQAFSYCSSHAEALKNLAETVNISHVPLIFVLTLLYKMTICDLMLSYLRFIM